MKNFLRITSKDNDNLKQISQLLKSSKRRRDEGLFVLEGLRLCLDAIQNGHVPQKVFLSETAISKYQREVEILTAHGDTYVLSDSLFSKFSDTVSPQGILCVCKTPLFDEEKFNPNGRYIALDNLQDPSNLGAIARTAEAFGIDGIIIQGGCDPYSPKSLRASMGALLRLPVYPTDDMFAVFAKNRLKSYASVISREADSVGEIRFNGGCVVIIGNEANGISAETVDKSDCLITIHMSGRAESLNAAVAASVIMWEMCK